MKQKILNALAKGPATAKELAIALDCTPETVRPYLKLLIGNGVRLIGKRRNSRGRASELFGLMEATNTSPPPVVETKPAIPVAQPATETKVVTAKFVAKSDLDTLVAAMGKQITDAIMAQVRVRLSAALGELVPQVVAAPDISAIISKLAVKPAPEKAQELPKIGVVGLLPVQAGEISSEFAGLMDLRFWNDGDGATKLKALGMYCEVVFLHTRHAGHNTDEILKNVGANIRRVTGGVSNLKDQMTNYFMERT